MPLLFLIETIKAVSLLHFSSYLQLTASTFAHLLCFNKWERSIKDLLHFLLSFNKGRAETTDAASRLHTNLRSQYGRRRSPAAAAGEAATPQTGSGKSLKHPTQVLPVIKSTEKYSLHSNTNNTKWSVWWCIATFW